MQKDEHMKDEGAEGDLCRCEEAFAARKRRNVCLGARPGEEGHSREGGSSLRSAFSGRSCLPASLS
ncbi:MAG: hypothetical protein ACLT98_11430 [Eggerthellaceae bacterium]